MGMPSACISTHKVRAGRSVPLAAPAPDALACPLLHACRYTGQPEITQASKALRRSVNELHAWDARRMQRIQHAAATQEEHVCDGCTFQPVINSTSRTMALHLWESGPPDPQRPWTSAPMRGSLPAPRCVQGW